MNSKKSFGKFNKIIDSISLNEITQSSGFTKRKYRKISPSDFVKTVVEMSIHCATSMRMGAFAIGLISSNTVSKTAFFKRMKKCGSQFLQNALLMFLTQKISNFTFNSSFDIFNRILIQDSTSIKLHPDLKCKYPGGKNQHTDNISSMKIQTIMDIKADKYLSFEVTPFTENDQSKSEDILHHLKPNDLVLRDLGYFSLSTLNSIAEKKVFFVSRLYSKVIIYDYDDNKLDLLKVLKRKTQVDIKVKIGAEAKLPVRLVAVRLPNEIAKKRKMNEKKKAKKDTRKIVTKESLELLNWSIMITNIDGNDVSSEEIFKLYEFRWRIENIFKNWKSNFQINNIPERLSPEQLECLIYGRLIYITLFHEICWKPIKFEKDGSFAPVSLFKLTKIFNGFYHFIERFLNDGQFEIVKKNLLIHSEYDSSTRFNYEQLFTGMS